MTNSRTVEVCILAGGLSSRMGTDKTVLRLGGKTFLARLRAAARQAHLPVRVIRRDLVPGCGPLGGVYTALRTTAKAAVVFLPCDMPFVTGELLEKLLMRLGRQSAAVFMSSHGRVGFPFLVKRDAAPVAEGLLERGHWSLQAFAAALNADRLRPTSAELPLLMNVNTPADFVLAEERLRLLDRVRLKRANSRIGRCRPRP